MKLDGVKLRELSLDDIESLAVGAWVLGTGGGGSPYLGLLNLRRLYAEGKRIQLMPPEDLADDDAVAVVSNQGAPLVGQERLTDSRTIARAVAMMEELSGKRFRAIMSLEIGAEIRSSRCWPRPISIARSSMRIAWAAPIPRRR
jgi:uncharacterized protein